MQLKSTKYLYDIEEAILKLVRFTQDKSFDDYLKDELLQSAVERQFEIIGEAVNKLNQQAPEVANHLSDKRKMISFRNILIHAYDSIDPMIVWGVLESDLDRLYQEIKQLMNQ